MSANRFSLKSRLRYISDRARNIDVGSVVTRAREVALEHRKPVPTVLVDMLWSAAFRNTAFQDYVDWDFAILSKAERATFMTHSISNHIAMKFDHPAHRSTFHHKIEFNRAFDAFLGREWLDVRSASSDEVRAFVERHRRVIGKVPVSSAGHGVERYEADEIDRLGRVPHRPARQGADSARGVHHAASDPRGDLPGNREHHPDHHVL